MLKKNGSFLGPAAASFALLYMSWRSAFVLFGAMSLIMGLALFIVRDQASDSPGATKRAQTGFEAYLQCLKNRNIVFTSLVLMAGASLGLSLRRAFPSIICTKLPPLLWLPAPP